MSKESLEQLNNAQRYRRLKTGDLMENHFNSIDTSIEQKQSHSLKRRRSKIVVRCYLVCLHKETWSGMKDLYISEKD